MKILISSFQSLFFILLTLVLLCNTQAQAQRPRKAQSLRSTVTEGFVTAGLQLNAMNYSGDIPTGVMLTGPGISAFIARKLGPKTHLQLSAAWGRIQGDDGITEPSTGTYARNFHFRNDIKELALNAQWDLANSYGKYFRRKGFTPYLYGGIAVFHHNPQAKIPESLGDSWVSLQPLGTEGQGRPGYAQPYSKMQFAIPLGIGLKFKLDERWDMGVETGIRFTFFDYLDDVSGQYPDMSDLGSPLTVALSNRSLEVSNARTSEARDFEAITARFGAPESYLGFDGQVYSNVPSFRRGGSTRGNPRSSDMYFISGIRMSYIINVGLKCPQFRW